MPMLLEGGYGGSRKGGGLHVLAQSLEVRLLLGELLLELEQLLLLALLDGVVLVGLLAPLEGVATPGKKAIVSGRALGL